jgi:hypothetical protein
VASAAARGGHVLAAMHCAQELWQRGAAGGGGSKGEPLLAEALKEVALALSLFSVSAAAAEAWASAYGTLALSNASGTDGDINASNAGNAGGGGGGGGSINVSNTGGGAGSAQGGGGAAEQLARARAPTHALLLLQRSASICGGGALAELAELLRVADVTAQVRRDTLANH